MSFGPRKIIHVDMDCFYAACEVKERPELRGKAIGIGGPADSRSVLCTASYEARKFGVRAAMPSSMAKRLCPQLLLIPPNFSLYKRESRAVHEIFKRFSENVEPLSLDEAYLDVSNSSFFGGSATLIAREIRRLIQSELGLTASAGVAPNKFLAKVASDWRKPNGLFVLRPEEVERFMPPLEVERIYGVGKVTATRMHELGIKTCADLQAHSVDQLCEWFGSRGEDLARLSRGIDQRELCAHAESKSLTVEETFRHDMASFGACLNALPALYEDWERRLKRSNYRDRIRGYVVKVKFSDFKSTTHETTAHRYPTLQDFEALLRKAWARKSLPVRLIGLGARLSSGEVELPQQLKLAL